MLKKFENNTFEAELQKFEQLSEQTEKSICQNIYPDYLKTHKKKKKKELYQVLQQTKAEN